MYIYIYVGEANSPIEIDFLNLNDKFQIWNNGRQIIEVADRRKWKLYSSFCYRKFFLPIHLTYIIKVILKLYKKNKKRLDPQPYNSQSRAIYIIIVYSQYSLLIFAYGEWSKHKGTGASAW